MKSLPCDATHRSTTPEFTEDTLPDGLKGIHRTGAGAWAKIVVLEGRLRYCILEPETEEHELSPDQHGIVEPEIPHRVEPIGRVRFQIEFYR